MADSNGVVEPHSQQNTERLGGTGLRLALILVLSLGIFAPTLLNGYTYDDPHYARTNTPTGDRNPMVASVQPVTEYWTHPMNWGLPSNCRGFRPVTVLSYAAVNTLVPPQDPKGDDNAWAHHLLNLLLHGLATWLVFVLVRPLTGEGGALIASLLFGVHAMHSGAVAAIVGRGEILTFVFGAITAQLYLYGLRRPRAVVLAATSLSWFLALSAKENAVAWAGFIPLLAWAHGFRWRPQLWSATLTLLLPLLAFLLLRHAMMVEHIHPRGEFSVEYDANPLYYANTVKRGLTATCILAFGLGKLLLPSNLSSNYGDGPFTLVDQLWNWRFLLASLLFAGLAIAAWRLRHHHRILTLAIAGFFGFTVITSNIPFPLETIFGERNFYAAVLAVALAGAWAAKHLVGRWRLAAILSLVGWTAFNTIGSVERSLAWHDNHTLTRADLANQPNSVGLHIDMGNLQLWSFNKAGGLAEFALALEINPQSARALRFLAENSPAAEAEQLLRRALRSPHLIRATEGRRIYWALGNRQLAAGQPAAAQRSFYEALRCNPYVPDIRIHLMHQASQGGRTEELRELLTAGLRQRPAYQPFELFRGILLHHDGEHAAAAKLLGRVLPGMREQQYVADARRLAEQSAALSGRTTVPKPGR